MEWHECNFSNLELIETSMRGEDVSSCNLEGLRADPKNLKGMIISIEQSYDLILLFGIIIR